jgi:hypothetical protein
LEGSELTMPCIHLGRLGVLCVGGPTLTIEVAGKAWRFELPPYCSLVIIGKRGDPVRTEPGPRHPFWRAVELWVEQGKRLDGNRCVWVEKPKPRMVRVRGRHYRLLESVEWSAADGAYRVTPCGDAP